MSARDAKKKISLTLTERHIRNLAKRSGRMGAGISEYLRRVLDNPAVIDAMNAMDPREMNDDSPDDYLRRVAQGKL